MVVADVRSVMIARVVSVSSDMARQIMSQKRTRQLAYAFNLPIVKVWVRGNTHHRKDLCLYDGTILNLYKDGNIYRSEIKWR